jgi:hypothetical protein
MSSGDILHTLCPKSNLLHQFLHLSGTIPQSSSSIGMNLPEQIASDLGWLGLIGLNKIHDTKEETMNFEIVLQLTSLLFIVAAGPLVIVLLYSRGGNL